MRYAILAISLFSALDLPAQPTRTVLDRKTGLPVSYATVRILKTVKGTIASGKGEFIIPIESGDSVLFSCAGYHDLVIAGKNISRTVYLDPEVLELKEVILRTGSLKTIKIGNEKRLVRGDIVFSPSPHQQIHTEFAQKIVLPDPGRTFKLTKAFIPVKRRNCYGPILVRIYECDSVRDWPGREIFIKRVEGRDIVFQRNAAVIDIRAANIFFNSRDSFFVSLSWPPGGFYDECRPLVLLSKRSNSQTYLRLFRNNPFEWDPFAVRFRDNRGSEFRARTFFAVEVEVYE
ncbi:MAG TPA: carboxypeptidase-like regulatory domain-containing protein [Chitinophagaceae bacterium]|nr:carboxypeptidase-like regulatory domain-containing protein [Chitinophagaceae bacterium]